MSNPYSAPVAEMSDVNADDETYQPKMFAMSGRIGRIYYMAYSFGFMVLAMFSIGMAAALTRQPALAVLLYIPVVAYSLVLAARRLNDLGHSGWMSLLMFVPFFGLYPMFAPGTSGSNRYGPKPVRGSLGLLLVPFIAVALIGILAAIAMPAYQQYMQRAKAAAAAAEPARPAEAVQDAPAPADAGAAPAEAAAPAEPTAPAAADTQPAAR